LTELPITEGQRSHLGYIASGANEPVDCRQINGGTGLLRPVLISISFLWLSEDVLGASTESYGD
jgi:hypothetical protein